MNVITDFCEKYEFPAEATASLARDYETLKNHPAALCVIERIVENYERDLPLDTEEMFRKIEGLESETGLPVRTLELLCLILMTPHLKELYQREGLADDLYDGAVLDLKWKALECHTVRGYWGSFFGRWNIDFFILNRFTFGRLQFDLQHFPRDMAADGLSFREGEPYVNTHIPSSGPLVREEYLDSYRRAAAFFKERYGLGKIVFGCRSWLLSPNNETILPPDSRILPFKRDFTILETKRIPESTEAWRIFGTLTLPENLSDLPADTSLRRAFIKWLSAGGTIDSAFGAFEYKG